MQVDIDALQTSYIETQLTLYLDRQPQLFIDLTNDCCFRILSVLNLPTWKFPFET